MRLVVLTLVLVSCAGRPLDVTTFGEAGSVAEADDMAMCNACPASPPADKDLCCGAGAKAFVCGYPQEAWPLQTCNVQCTCQGRDPPRVWACSCE